MSALEIVAVAVSFAAIWLTARRHMLCWPLGLVSVALYAKIFFDARLYSDMLLQGIFAVFQLYGWVLWLRGREATGEIVIEAPSSAALARGSAAGALGTVVLGSLMARYTDAAVPWLDAMLTSFSLVGQYWTARKYIESWWLWIAVDVVYTGLFVYKGLYPTAGLYAAFVAIAAVGLRDWRRAQRRQPVPSLA